MIPIKDKYKNLFILIKQVTFNKNNSSRNLEFMQAKKNQIED